MNSSSISKDPQAKFRNEMECAGMIKDSDAKAWCGSVPIIKSNGELGPSETRSRIPDQPA